MKKDQSFLTKAHIFAATFFVVFLFLLYQMVRMIEPFTSALLWAGLIALIFHPLYRRLLGLVKGRANLAAAVMTLGTFLLVIGPMTTLFGALAAQAGELYQSASDFVQTGGAARLLETLKTSALGRVLYRPELVDFDLKGMIIKGLGQLSSSMAGQVGGVIKNTVMLAVNFVIMLFSLFFFFRNGEEYYTKLVKVLPFTAKQKRSIANRVRDTFSAVINGMFLIALFQGLMTGVGLALFGVPFAVLWGVVTAFCALLPVGGSALVWLPAALYLFFTGSTLNAVLLVVWGVVAVSLPDNFIRPLLIGRKANIPTFFLFIGILGGLSVYGPFGILFGPIVVTLVTVFVQLYQEEYARR